MVIQNPRKMLPKVVKRIGIFHFAFDNYAKAKAATMFSFIGNALSWLGMINFQGLRATHFQGSWKVKHKHATVIFK